MHEATLVDGRRVVLKLQHREVRRVIKQDLAQAEALASTLQWLEPEVDLRPLISEMHGLHAAELDFRTEAANLAAVASNLCRRRVIARLPPTVPSLCTSRCLVMGFCEGVPLVDGAALKTAHGVDVELLVSRVCEAWGCQLFADGHFNCDPHPGNLLVCVTADLGPVPVLLDFGLCRRLEPKTKLAFCRMVHSLATLDVDALIASLAAAGVDFGVEVVDRPHQLLRLAFHTHPNPHPKPNPNRRGGRPPAAVTRALRLASHTHPNSHPLHTKPL